MKTLEQKLKEISPKRQEKIKARTRELVAREMSLRELRHAVTKLKRLWPAHSIWVRMESRDWRSEVTCCFLLCGIMWKLLEEA